MQLSTTAKGTFTVLASLAVLSLGCSDRRSTPTSASQPDADAPAPPVLPPVDVSTGSQNYVPIPPSAIPPVAPPAGGPGSSPGAIRPPLTFPIRNAQPGQYDWVAAYPNMPWFNAALLLTAPPDQSNRVFIVDQEGRIFVFPNNPTVSNKTTFLDIRSRVTWANAEGGLLGMAFDPDYAQNRTFYVAYTRHNPDSLVLSRMLTSSNPDAADPSSEQILLSIPQTGPYHNGGMIAFGSDRLLYMSVGDDGNDVDSQNLSRLTGKILRIDPHTRSGSLPYGIPPSNPFVGRGGSTREEVWAYGLRNPWRFSFDRQTGAMWVGDVGNLREEINVVAAGDNCGWPVYDGSLPHKNPTNLPPSAFKMPIREYVNGGPDGIAVIGGYVYRGSQFPELRGTYIHSDWISQKAWALSSANGSATQLQQIAHGVGPFSFGEDENGEIYAVVGDAGPQKLQRRGGGPPPPPFPQRLSETGIFRNVATLEVHRGVHEYSVNAPLWSDHAEKRRWLVVPDGKVTFHPTDAWAFPLGTVMVKHFEIPMQVGNPGSMRRLETRVMVHEQGGWAGYTYRWNAQQDDAVLLADGLDETLTIQDPQAPGGQRTQVWRYPSRAECMQCHTPAAGHVLGVRTGQVNRRHRFVSGREQNVLDLWNSYGLFDAPVAAASNHVAYANPADPTATDDARARAYLASNCAHCHLPGGPGRTSLDLRHDIPQSQMQAVGIRPSISGLGIPDPYVVRKGDATSSVLWERMRRTDAHRMPKAGSSVVDDAAVTLIRNWINTLP